MQGLIAGLLLAAAAPAPLEVLAGAVRGFFAVQTLEARVESTRKDGLGRVTHGSYAIRFAAPEQFALVTLEPAGFVEGYDDGRLVAWNDRLRTGFAGDGRALRPDLRERLGLVPGFGLNPILPIDPAGYDLTLRAGATFDTVVFAPKDSRHAAIEMDVLREPYRVAAVRMEQGSARTTIEYDGWRDFGGVWLFATRRTVRLENRMKTEETLRYGDIRVNTALPNGWLPSALPVSYAAEGIRFFAD
jgi:hypothetical protein